VAVVGERLRVTGKTTLIVAVLDNLGSATDVAVTYTSAGFGTVAGAKYRPSAETVPQAEPLHPLPMTLQETLVLETPTTVAVNC
jgi:hypothetical protein